MTSRRDVFVIAATNRPDIIDPAMMRPGRLDKHICVPLPSKIDRENILKTLAGKKTPLGKDVDFSVIAEKTDGFTGADLAGLCRESTMTAIRMHLLEREEKEKEERENGENKETKDEHKKSYSVDGGLVAGIVGGSGKNNKQDLSGALGESMKKTITVDQKHFLTAREKVGPSVSESQRKHYVALAEKLKKGGL
jgi:SpoVK/Ycf46/Vps4 family AAA+-type ATPase